MKNFQRIFFVFALAFVFVNIFSIKILSVSAQERGSLETANVQIPQESDVPPNLHKEVVYLASVFVKMYQNFNALPAKKNENGKKEKSKEDYNNDFFKYTEENFDSETANLKIVFSDRFKDLLKVYFKKIPRVKDAASLYRGIKEVMGWLNAYDPINNYSVAPGNFCFENRDCFGKYDKCMLEVEGGGGKQNGLELNMACKKAVDCKSNFCDPSGYCSEYKICVRALEKYQPCDPDDVRLSFCGSTNEGFRCVPIHDYTRSKYSNMLSNFNNIPADLLCKLNGVECSDGKECCDNVCEIGKSNKKVCKSKYVCSDCVEAGVKYRGKQECCPNLYKDEDNKKCIPDDPELIKTLTPPVTKSSKKEYTPVVKILKKIFNLLIIDTSYALEFDRKRGDDMFCPATEDKPSDGKPLSLDLQKRYIDIKNDAFNAANAFNVLNITDPVDNFVLGYIFINKNMDYPKLSSENIPRLKDESVFKISTRQRALAEFLDFSLLTIERLSVVLKEIFHLSFLACHCSGDDKRLCRQTAWSQIMANYTLRMILEMKNSAYDLAFSTIPEDQMESSFYDMNVILDEIEKEVKDSCQIEAFNSENKKFQKYSTTCNGNTTVTTTYKYKIDELTKNARNLFKFYVEAMNRLNKYRIKPRDIDTATAPIPGSPYPTPLVVGSPIMQTIKTNIETAYKNAVLYTKDATTQMPMNNVTVPIGSPNDWIGVSSGKIASELSDVEDKFYTEKKVKYKLRYYHWNNRVFGGKPADKGFDTYVPTAVATAFDVFAKTDGDPEWVKKTYLEKWKDAYPTYSPAENASNTLTVKRTKNNWKQVLEDNGYTSLSKLMNEILSKNEIPFKDGKPSLDNLLCWQLVSKSTDGEGNGSYIENIPKDEYDTRAFLHRTFDSSCWLPKNKFICENCGDNSDFACSCIGMMKNCETYKAYWSLDIADPVDAHGGSSYSHSDCQCDTKVVYGHMRTYKACFAKEFLCGNKGVPLAFCVNHQIKIDGSYLVNAPIPAVLVDPFKGDPQMTFAEANEKAFSWVVDKNNGGSYDSQNRSYHAINCIDGRYELQAPVDFTPDYTPDTVGVNTQPPPKVIRFDIQQNKRSIVPDIIPQYSRISTTSAVARRHFGENYYKFLKARVSIAQLPLEIEYNYSSVYDAHYLAPYKNDDGHFPLNSLSKYYDTFITLTNNPAPLATALVGVQSSLKEYNKIIEDAIKERGKDNVQLGVRNNTNLLQEDNQTIYSPGEKQNKKDGPSMVKGGANTTLQFGQDGTTDGSSGGVSSDSNSSKSSTKASAISSSKKAGQSFLKRSLALANARQARYEKLVNAIGKTERGKQILKMEKALNGTYRDIASKKGGNIGRSSLSSGSSSSSSDSSSSSGDMSSGSVSSGEGRSGFSSSSGSGYGGSSGNYGGGGSYGGGPGNSRGALSSQEQKQVLDNIEKSKGSIVDSDDDTIFKKISNAYVRSLKKLIEKKND
ncbi:MAG: hypothetical protein HQK49_11140 [Oligoflexia bacterium]|nr:hypothetical protein [Oligoflexia bacterium]